MIAVMSQERSLFEQVTKINFDTLGKVGLDKTIWNAYNGLAAEPLTYEQYVAGRTLMGQREVMDSDGIGAEEYERALDFSSIESLLMGNNKECSILSDWQLYDTLFAQYGRKRQGGNALMIGSIAALSARTFAVMAPQLYGTDRSLIIDIAGGRDKASHGTFVFADGLAMPFKDASVDVMQTSQLTHYLQGEGSWRDTSQRLFSEMGRVAAPGAQVLMRELHPDRRRMLPEIMGQDSAYGRYIENGLRSVGFEEVHIAPTRTAVSYDYILVRGQKMSEVATSATEQTVTVFARKGA